LDDLNRRRIGDLKKGKSLVVVADGAAEFVQFSLRLYMSPGVSPLCLALQDGAGFDINLLLLAAWAAKLGYSIDAELWKELEHAVAPIRDRAVIPLRSVRRQVTRDPKLPEDLRAPIKRMMLYAEVRAEQAEERVLHDRMSLLAKRAEPGEPLLRANLAALAVPATELEQFATLVMKTGLLEEESCRHA
jgi:uncharacterized protein (TIGR02444 family)